jgi:hypothetical protein
MIIAALLVVAVFTWGNAVSVAALAVAVISLVVSLVFTRRADRRARRAEERATRRDEREEADVASKRRPIVTQSGRTEPKDGPHAGQVVYEYEVRNEGYTVITELHLWIEDAEGNGVSTSGGGLMDLRPNGPPVFVGGVGLMQPRSTGLRLVVKWTDADGEHGPEWTGLRPSVA